MADGDAEEGPASTESAAPGGEAAGDTDEIAALRRRVEERYDFDAFGPADMAEMSREEWEAVFDPDAWITGTELLDRVEVDLGRRIADRDVFARLERLSGPDRLAAYSDEGYAVVYADGSVSGQGTVRRDVEPSVALCSMPDYDVPDAPADVGLPDPVEVPEGRGQFGHRMLMVVAAVQLVAGAVLFATWVTGGVGLVALVAGLGFLLVGIVLLVVVANARIADRFRADEYRNRLRALDGESTGPPAFREAARSDGVATSRWGEAAAEEWAEPGDDAD